MWHYITLKGKYVYFDVINNMINTYNKSYHRTIKMRPIDVDSDQVQEIYERVFTNTSTIVKKFSLKIDDKVRISKYKTVFSKGYTPNWSEEIFKVSEQVAREPNVYKISDLAVDRVEGIFYELELQKVSNDDDIYKVESIVRTRVRNKQKEVLVKWLGYPEKFNSWEPAENLNLKKKL